MNRKQELILQQVDRKLQGFREAKKESLPPKGWIYTIRKALNMTQQQLAKRLGITKQYVSRMEHNEPEGGITLSSMKEVARSLDMEFVYAIVPKEDSLEHKVRKRAQSLAKEIVERTAQSMALEDQEVSDERLQYSIEEKTDKLMDEMPKYLWD